MTETLENDKKHKLRNATLLLVSTMTVMASATIAPATTAIVKAFGDVENAQFLVKIILTIPGLIIALSAPFVGFILDRWNKKKVLIISTLIYGISGSAGYFLNDLYALIASRVILGFAVTGIMVTCTTLIADYFEGVKRSQYAGLQAAFGGFGGVLFIFLGGVLADLSWNVPFLIYTLAFVLMPMVLMYIVEPPKRTPPSGKNSEQPEAPSQFKLVGFCYFLALLEIFILYMVPVHYPFFIANIEQVSHTQTGIAIAVMMLAMALTSALYKHIKALFNTFQVLHASGMFLLAFGYILLSSAQSYSFSIIYMILAGIGLGMMRPNLVVWLFSFTPPAQRGRIMGGLTSFFFIGQFVCPVVTEPIINAYGYPAAFKYAGVALFIFAAAYMLFFTLLQRSNLPDKETA